MNLIQKAGLSVTALAAFAMAGCPHSTTSSNTLKPAITVTSAAKSINTGDSTGVMASTENLAGNSQITWQVSPSTGRITVDNQDPNGLHARFSANEPGTYIVKATARAADGSTTSDETNIAVSGPMVNRNDNLNNNNQNVNNR